MWEYCFQIIFQAHRSFSVNGDIAIDDVQLINCNFPSKYLVHHMVTKFLNMKSLLQLEILTAA